MTGELHAHVERLRHEAQEDQRSTPELVTAALTEPDENAAGAAVGILHFRGTREVFETACQLCSSECPQERRLGANILGQLGVPHRSFPSESVKVLLRLLHTETDEDVLHAACI